jgi:hypothetical protein
VIFFSSFFQPFRAAVPTLLMSQDSGMTVICAFLQKKTSEQFAALPRWPNFSPAYAV